MISLVLVVPAAMKNAADRVSVALGHADPGGETYEVPLAPGGAAPATHHACHTWVTPEFVAIVSAAAARTSLPAAPWAQAGLTEAEVYDVCEALIVSAQENANPRAHFESVLESNSLAVIVE